MAETKNLLPEALNTVTEDNWKKCESHVIKEEVKMMALDHIIDDNTEKFIINTGETSSSSESE